MRFLDRHLRANYLALIGALVLAGCGSAPPREPPIDPDAARSQIRTLIPASVQNRDGWAVDVFAALEALEVRPTPQNICAVLAVTQQESGFQADPVVPDLGSKARREIDTRAAGYHVPKAVVSLALNMNSPDGRSYAERLNNAKTERELSVIFEDFIGRVPLGRQLFSDLNPVRTGGPMQVSIAFAEEYAADHRYPYPLTESVRHEVFTRRGGLYFGSAHLLDYPVTYDAMLYRFADFNAGHYASRNAAFQKAVSTLTRTPLALDGDLLLPGSGMNEPGQTELGVRTLSTQLGLSDREIRRDLELEKGAQFEKTDLYEKVFKLADRKSSSAVPRAVVPSIRLKSVKITRKLTTDWFARRVDGRYQQCLARAGE
jgi:Protein of unknown function (DUF1615)